MTKNKTEFCIYVPTPEDSIRVQQILFRHNYKWLGREGEELRYTDKPFLFFRHPDSNYSLLQYTTMSSIDFVFDVVNNKNYRLITLSELCALFEEPHHALD